LEGQVKRKESWLRREFILFQGGQGIAVLGLEGFFPGKGVKSCLLRIRERGFMS